MATFTFNCPQCGNLLSGEEEWRGMETQCPYCQKAIIIPVDKDYENSDIPQKTACRKKQIWKISRSSLLCWNCRIGPIANC